MGVLAQRVIRRALGADHALLYMTYRKKYLFFGESLWTGKCSCGHHYRNSWSRKIIEQEAREHINLETGYCPFEMLYRGTHHRGFKEVNKTTNLPF